MMTRFAWKQLTLAIALLPLVSAQAMQAQREAIPSKTAAAAAGPAATAQSAAARPAAAQPQGEEEKEAGPGNATGGGIKIHGHWLLQVKNPDGKLVDRREFNNSLITGYTCSPGGYCAFVTGDQLIAAILSGDLTPGGFGVGLVTGSIQNPDLTILCYPASGQITTDPINHCYGLVDANTVLSGWPNDNPSLNGLGAPTGGYQVGLTTTVNFTSPVSIVLSGNYQVGCTDAPPNNTLTCGGTMAPITVVQTFMAGCGNATNSFGTSYSGEIALSQHPNNRFAGSNLPGLQAGVPSSNCTAAAQANPASPVAVVMGLLTSTFVPGGGLTVTSGQIITVTVTLSFS